MPQLRSHRRSRTFGGRKSGAEQDKENPKDHDNNRYGDYCGDDVFSLVLLHLGAEHELFGWHCKLGNSLRRLT
jgi:hypothetical protein